MALDAGGVAGGVAGWLNDALTPVGGAAVDGVGNLLKEDAPVPLGGGYLIPVIGQEVGRQACKRYADNSGLFDPGVAAGYERLCRPYLDDIGYGQPPTIGKPFEGGQCPGVRYLFDYEGKQRGAVIFQGTWDLLGPIRLEVGGWDGGGPDPCTGEKYSKYTAIGGDNVGFSVITGCAVEGRIFNVRPINPNAVANCGNPAPVVKPPVPPVVPLPPGPRPFNPGPGIDIDIDVTIGPTGDITFNIGTGPITIDPFPDGGGGGGGSDPGIDQPGTAPSSGLPPGDIGSPAAPTATTAGGSAAGCAPPNSVLVGIKIDILLAPQFSSEYDPLVRRGVCYAYMGTPGNLALDPSGVALRSGQMLFAPLDNLTCWEVRANTGYILRITPYYRALELQEV